MKEFPLVLTESVISGLRADYRNPKNDKGLRACYNLKPYRKKLIAQDTIYDPFVSISQDWPFPQIFKGRGVTLLCNETEIYEVDEAGYGLTQITTYDAYSTGTEKSISAGKRWHFIDHGRSWILSNGSCMIFRMYKEQLTGGTDKTLVVDDIFVQTGCQHRGRALLGGFNSEHFWNTGWEALWSSFASGWKGSIALNNYHLEDNFIMWSSIGGNLFWLIYSSLVTSGYLSDGGESGYSSSHLLFTDMLKRNELGWMPMPWQGKILSMNPLGQVIMVYGEGGVHAVRPVPEPVTTYGEIKLTDNPIIMSRGAIGSSNKGQVFIDIEGNLWYISAELEMIKLGYSEFFSPMRDRDINISYNVYMDEFIISDGLRCFALTKSGLGEIGLIVSTLSNFKDGLVGVVRTSGERSSSIQTEELDMGLRAIKTIQTVKIGADDYSGMAVTIYYRNNTSDKYRGIGPFPVSPEGVATSIVSGVDFIIEVRKTPGDDVSIDSLSCSYIVQDKRNIRGVYANEANYK